MGVGGGGGGVCVCVGGGGGSTAVLKRYVSVDGRQAGVGFHT